MENFDHILIFKTDIKTKADKELVRSLLDNDEAIHCWNVDQEDIDCVLRVISYTLKPTQIIERIKCSGYECCELT